MCVRPHIQRWFDSYIVKTVGAQQCTACCQQPVKVNKRLKFMTAVCLSKSYLCTGMYAPNAEPYDCIWLCTLGQLRTADSCCTLRPDIDFYRLPAMGCELLL